MGIIEDIKKQLEPYDVIRKINALESKVNTLEGWKTNTVSPNLRELFNQTADNASKALNASSIATSAASKAESAFSKASESAQEAMKASNIATSASKLSQDAKDAALSAVSQAKDAANIAVLAKNDAGVALNDAKNAMNKAIEASNKASQSLSQVQLVAQNVNTLAGEINTVAQNTQNAMNEAKSASNSASNAMNEAVKATNQAIAAAQQALDASNIANMAKTDIIDIHNWINNEAIPNITTALSNAQSAAQEAINASGLAQTAQNAVAGMANAVNDARAQVFKVRDVFINISSKIGARVNNIKTLTLNLSNAISDGMDSIKVNADRIAARFPRWGEIFKKDIEHVFQQAKDTVNEMAIPLERVKHYTDIIKDPNIIDLLLTFYNVYMAFGHLIFIPYGNQGSVIQELEEGFTQTFGALQELGVDMRNGMAEWEANIKILFNDVKNKFNIIGSIMGNLNNEIMGLFTDIGNEIAILLPT